MPTVPALTNSPPSGIGLALSGGGYRSTLFQVGTLTRLNELGLLPKLSCISSVSGGSIANGFLAKQWSSLNFDANGVGRAFAEAYRSPLMAFCRSGIDIKDALSSILNPFENAGDLLTKSLAALLGKGTLQDIPASKPGIVPRFLFNATSLQSGVRFTLSREVVGDYRIGFTTFPAVELARTVAASTAFPPFFCPVRLDISGYQFAPHWDANGRDTDGNESPWEPDWYSASPNPNDPGDPERASTVKALHTTAYLADGGVYDNMGLQAIQDQNYAQVWVSDASAPSR